MRAFILAMVKTGKEDEVQNSLIEVKNVEVYQIYGEYDLMIVADFETEDKLNNYILDTIRKHPYIKHTSTMLVAKGG